VALAVHPTVRRSPFRRPLAIVGWAEGSRWGYDDVLEAYWAELVPVHGDRGPGGGVRRVGPEHLLVTVPGLAAAVARLAGCDERDAYLALVA
jgi:hypothetical protein